MAGELNTLALQAWEEAAEEAIWRGTRPLRHTLTEIREQLERIEKNMITETQFKTDLAGFLTAFKALLVAVNAKAAATSPTDLTAEDNDILAAAAAAQTALTALNPPVPVPPVVVPPTVVPPTVTGP